MPDADPQVVDTMAHIPRMAGNAEAAGTHRTLTRRSLLRATGVGVAGAALSGITSCGSGAVDNGGKTVLSWWDYYDGSNQKAVQQQLERYMKLHPNVRVERRAIPFANLRKTLLRGASAGELPDIVVIDNPDHATFAELGVLEDITDRVKSWGHGDEYFEGPWKSTIWQGKNYGIPDNSNCLTLWYNKDLLRSAGTEPPRDWSELKAAAEKLTGGDRYGFAVSAVQSEEATFQWLPFLWQTGADIGNIDGPGGRAALQLWTDLVNKGWMSDGILGWDQAAVKNQFVNEQAAMMVNGPWQIPAIKKEAPELRWDVVALPQQKTSASILGGENRAIVAGSANADAAWDLLTWTQRPDVLREYLITAGKLPSRSKLAEDSHWADDPVLGVFVDQLKVARPRDYGPKYTEISSALQIAIQAAISGDSTVTQALARADQKITPLLAGQA